MSHDGRTRVEAKGFRKHVTLPYDERAALRRIAISFGAYSLERIPVTSVSKRSRRGSKNSCILQY
jgi:hypothetical protein